MRRRHFIAGGAAALAAPALVRADSASTLRFVPYAELSLLDPCTTTNYVTRTHSLLVFDLLYGVDEALRPRPQMVAGHVVSSDGLEWRLTLRDGLRFHDGEPVLARDAVASIRRWAPRDSFGSALLDATDELSAPDDRTIRFRLRRPFPYLPDALAKPSTYVPVIMPERLAATPPNVAVQEMVGSGPYRFDAEGFVPGALATYARFEGYRPREEGQPSFLAGPRIARFERIEWRTIVDGATAAAALRAGEVDWVEQPDVDRIDVLLADRGVRLDVVETMGLVGQIRFNHLLAPFNTPGLARVLTGAIDQMAMMDAVAGPNPVVRRNPAGVFTPGGPMASTAGLDRLTRPIDIDRSKRELDASNYQGQPVTLLSASDVPRINAICQLLARTCRALGVPLNLISMSWAKVNQRILRHDEPATGGWNAFGTYSGGIDQLTPGYHLMTRGTGLAGAPSWLNDPPIEALRAEWFRATDLDRQRSIAAQIQARVFETGAYIPCGQYFPPTAYRTDLVDIAKGLPLFTGVQRKA